MLAPFTSQENIDHLTILKESIQDGSPNAWVHCSIILDPANRTPRAEVTPVSTAASDKFEQTLAVFQEDGSRE
jgi:hypothetical protein